MEGGGIIIVKFCGENIGTNKNKLRRHNFEKEKKYTAR